jgi:hypothetical protein
VNPQLPDEIPGDPPAAPGFRRTTSPPLPAAALRRGEYQSVQVNVDEFGFNIVGDAANEPSIAVDPTNHNRLAIGWRQFDTITSNFRQAGWAYSNDTGRSWTFPGVLEPGVFRSDPVLDADNDGDMYYYSLTDDFTCQVFRSVDGGMSWSDPVPAFGGDKGWMTIDRTGGVGDGNIYCVSRDGVSTTVVFPRSFDSGQNFDLLVNVPEDPGRGTIAVGPGSEVYAVGLSWNTGNFTIARSSNAYDPKTTTVFELSAEIDLGGQFSAYAGPNPGGLLGQVWVACDNSGGPQHGNVYVLSSVDPPGVDPLDVMFIRSTDGGQTWSNPVRVNDDATTYGWQWFGTMSVAPNGRIDVIWADTRNDPDGLDSELYYSYSEDAGDTWSANEPLSPPFDPYVGWPQQNKLGDYYDMVSDNAGVNVAYAATFNGEQDVYFLRIWADCNENGVPDNEDIAEGTSEDCTDNWVPDECDPDCNGNEQPDPCEILEGKTADCDGNWIPDECESDFDGDGTIDACDPDIDNDGVANEEDVCEFTPLGVPVTAEGRPIGDMSGDCDVDLADFALFPTCISLSGPGNDDAPALCFQWYDHEGDQDVDMGDFMLSQTAFTGPNE